ncbi:MAG: tol-pal system protein YbgF, partial [Gammaproteobacteria bacterium RIFCSPHIGHO2_12_FULL_45_12]
SSFLGGSADTSPSSLDGRVKKLEQQIDTFRTTNVTPRVDSLQTEVQALRGQVELLTHQLQQLEEQQKAQYVDLDKRVTEAVETASKKAKMLAADSGQNVAALRRQVVQAKTPPKMAAVTAPVKKEEAAKETARDDQPNVAEEQKIYQTAYTMIKAKQYDGAVKVLQDMLHKYPTGQFASNAHYWLGELFGLQGKHELALVEFKTVVKSYPSSPRVSDAQLKVGLILASQSNWSEAKSALNAVINHYPGTSSARLAKEQLKQIKQAGH